MEIKPAANQPIPPRNQPEPLKLSVPQEKVDTSSLNKTALDPKALEKVESTVNKVSKQELEKVIDNLNRFLGVTDRPSLKFQIHEQTNKLMVSVMDLNTKQIIRQLPPKEVLDMEARIQYFVGLLIDEKI